MNQFKPAIYYLPHELPMVLVETVNDIGDDYAACSVTVSKEGILASFLRDNGAIPAWFGIEMIAQTIGVWCGFHGMKKNREPKLGMLLGTRAFKSAMPEFPANSQLDIYAKLLLQDDKLGNFDCRIALDGNTIVQAKLNVYQPDDQEIALLIKQGSTI